MWLLWKCGNWVKLEADIRETVLINTNMSVMPQKIIQHLWTIRASRYSTLFVTQSFGPVCVFKVVCFL